MWLLHSCCSLLHSCLWPVHLSCSFCRCIVSFVFVSFRLYLCHFDSIRVVTIAKHLIPTGQLQKGDLSWKITHFSVSAHFPGSSLAFQSFIKKCLHHSDWENKCYFMFFTLFIPLEDVVLPDRPKLKFLNKVPNFKKAKKESKKLQDIQGPAQTSNTFTTGQFAIVVSAFIVWKSCLPTDF